MTLLGSQPEHDSSSLASSTWHAVTVAGAAALQSQVLVQARVVHAFTLRPDGRPTGAQPDLADGPRQRERLCTALGCEANLLTHMEQVHGARVAIVEPPMVGRCVEGVDGLVVDRPGVPLLALSADCPLVVVCDPQRGVLGLAHAGWRGIVCGVVGSLVRTLVDRFGCRPEGIVAAVSPSAGPCCYQVGDEVVASAAQALPDSERHFQRRRGSTFFDLRSACAAQLHLAGIEAQRIDPAGECTICDDRFFSYRRDGAETGHAGLIAALSEG